MPEMDDAPSSGRDLLLELLLDRLDAIEGAATPAEQARLEAQLDTLEARIAAWPGDAPSGPPASA
ncbi:hypothetical protein [Roseicella aquatilis]|uniref:DUF4404 family protein n=1 Tax=Roseicella aquatilis TaxID=2527868 RepID=A0A4R4DKK5_9PROT|nr:hypothetical protein [Roseicella aquatilis]TCZ61159.1 hypothetical protein EXY23_13610 [Roseicella aquatilis]